MTKNELKTQLANKLNVYAGDVHFIEAADTKFIVVNGHPYQLMWKPEQLMTEAQARRVTSEDELVDIIIDAYKLAKQ